MSVETRVISEKPLTLGCYRKRLAIYNESIVYTNGSTLYSENKEILTLPSQIYDIQLHNDQLYMITETGDVTVASDTTKTNSVTQKYGFYSALESLTKGSANSYIAAANDITHTIRLIDPENLTTVSSMKLPDQICCFTSSEGLLASADGRTVSLIDPREMKCLYRSGALSSPPTAISLQSGHLIVTGEDRRIRQYDSRRLKSPILTTKPATKNGAVALFANEGGDACISIGCDEAMTLAVFSEDVGQFKRGKYLAETPWASAPSIINGRMSLITRGGVLHQFERPFDFSSTNKEAASGQAVDDE
ncbi:hypothetical protein TRFO_05132 [Tritrichomonas foetus]|uniref:Uncharacterized protein n=1 Tax=Tritrichomonas foetus TaxID=1144522 RepID=A0A1J4KDI1_9EUKA|nr:hypothetical protein TRFO_05132 [Tritrichomonas foetus]|eukprot:OHT07517.1 hypothetical protein TRFO_05132 [Tritrichomonas foetus]